MTTRKLKRIAYVVVGAIILASTTYWTFQALSALGLNKAGLLSTYLAGFALTAVFLATLWVLERADPRHDDKNSN
jgi:high-affinity Fe2+/Pb2+ permease